MYNNITLRTPVDTGRARANWNVSKGQPDLTTTDATRKNVTLEDVPTAKDDEPYFITNNLPYIKKLEYGGYTDKEETEKTVHGYSKQAPHGMVGVTVADAKELFDEAVRGVK